MKLVSLTTTYAEALEGGTPLISVPSTGSPVAATLTSARRQRRTPPVSRDLRPIRGAVSGGSLSARAAAATIRDSLVEEAEVAQSSDEFEAVATKLVQIFPVRRCRLICP